MATVCKICADPKEPTLSLRRLPGPGPHRGALDESDCGHCADLPAHVLRARRDMVRGLLGVRPTVLGAGASSCHAAKPNGHPIPPFPSPRTASAPLLTSRSLCPLARRREMTPCPFREGGLGGIEARSNGQTSKRSPWGFCLRLSRSWILPGVLQKSLPGVSLTLGISGPHGKLTRGRLSPSSLMYTSNWWKCGLHTDRRASTLPHRPSFPMWMEQSPTGTCALLPSRRPSLRTCSLQQPRP